MEKNINIVRIVKGGSGMKNKEMDTAMAFRQKLLSSHGCSFDVVITADYGDKIQTFSMFCKVDAVGNLKFTVTDPKTISGIEGEISDQSAAITFDDKVLAFEPIIDDVISPVTAPWILIHTLRSGYVTSSGKDGDNIRVAIDDSYKEDALHLDIWLTQEKVPVRGEILWKGRRTLSVDVRNFTFM